MRLKLVTLLAGLALALTSPAGAAPLTAPANLPSSPEMSAIALERLLADLAGRRDEIVGLQRELVRRPALPPEHGGPGEEAKALWIEGWLRERGLPAAERLDSPDTRVPSKIRPNLIIFYPGSSPTTLWLVGHLDVAPAGPEELWTGSPWALRQVGDRLYGRGVEDDHQCLAAGLILLESLARQKITPPLSLGLIFTSDAKTPHQEHGLGLVLKTRPEIFYLRDNLIVLNDFGDSQGSIIEVAEKGLYAARVTILGRQAHAARPDSGASALSAGARFITALEGLPHKFPATDDLFDPPGCTFSATRVEPAETAPNQIPGKFEFYIDARFLPEYELAEIEAAVKELARQVARENQVSIEIKPITSLDAAPPTSGDSPAVRSLERAVRAQLGQSPKLAGNSAVTMARIMRREPHKLPVAVWAKSEGLGASPNESVSLTAIIESAQVFARMLFDTEAIDGR